VNLPRDETQGVGIGKGYMKGHPSLILEEELGTVAIGCTTTKTCGNIIEAAYALATQA
jgi:hypothetical protein